MSSAYVPPQRTVMNHTPVSGGGLKEAQMKGKNGGKPLTVQWIEQASHMVCAYVTSEHYIGFSSLYGTVCAAAT